MGKYIRFSPKLVFILFFLFIFSCKKESNDLNTNLHEYKIEINNAKAMDDLSFIKSANFIFLERKHLVGKIKKLYLNDEKIFIWDSSRDNIAVFNTVGEFEFTIDKKGKGPDEYINIADMCYIKDSDEILILEKKRVLAYSGVDGKFLYSRKLDFAPISIEGIKDELFFYNPFTFNYKSDKYKYALITTDGKNKVISKRFENTDELGNFLHLASSQKGFGYGHDLLFVNRFDYNINNLSNNSNYKLLFRNIDKMKNDLKKAISLNDLSIVENGAYVTSISNIVNTKSEIFLNYNKGESINFMFIDKENGNIDFHGNRFKIISEELLEKGILLFDLPFTATEDRFVSIIDAYSIIELLPVYEKYKESMCDYYEAVSSLEYDDNPIIALYELEFSDQQ